MAVSSPTGARRVCELGFAPRRSEPSPTGPGCSGSPAGGGTYGSSSQTATRSASGPLGSP